MPEITSSKPALVGRRPPRPPRATTTQRGYGHEHQQDRKRYLAEHPVCERCRRAFSEHLHHRDRDTFNRDGSNYEALCGRCHHREHG